MMNALSVFDLFKIGLGPSSSHTNGPMKAALYFSEILGHQLDQVQRIQVSCYGSLALTGKGHGTDKAILLGLQGIAPENATSALVAQTYQKVQADQKIHLAGKKWLPFHIDLDLLWERSKTLPKHPNGMKFQAFDLANQIIKESIIYSVGGGFIHIENAKPMESQATKSIPYIFESAKDLLELGEKHQLKLWQIVLENEKTHMLESRVREKIDLIWSVMIQTMEHGFTQTGTLPGGMKVRRRSPELYKHLLAKGTGNSTDPLLALDWINLFALSVNEENASFGRIVTAPTNGAAGVIPAVLRYYRDFIPGATQEGIHRFFLTATAIGTLYKMNASISGAEVGCQGEVGVASSMAAGAMTEVLGGTNTQIENAAEIAMEHHLGMTCDPVGGLVQIPCIERNAMGAVKAINAARMALQGDGQHAVSLDQVIKTMWETGQDMSSKYKETSRGGLAVNWVEC